MSAGVVQWPRRWLPKPKMGVRFPSPAPPARRCGALPGLVGAAMRAADRGGHRRGEHVAAAAVVRRGVLADIGPLVALTRATRPRARRRGARDRPGGAVPALREAEWPGELHERVTGLTAAWGNGFSNIC